VIESLKFTSNGQEQKPASLPPSTTTIEPLIFAKAVSKVEYQLDGGEIVVSYQQPFTYTLRGATLDPAVNHVLAVKVFGSEGRADLVSEQSVTVTIAGGVSTGSAVTSNPSPATAASAGATGTAGTAATPGTPSPLGGATSAAPATVPATATNAANATPAPEPSLIDTFLGNPVLLGALVIGILALLALAVMIAMSAARRHQAQMAGPPTDVLSSPYTLSNNPSSTSGTGTGTGTGSGPGTGTGGSSQIFTPPNDDRTQMFADMGDSQKTQVFQVAKALLEVLNGPTKGDTIPIGIAGKNSIAIGRDADPLLGDLKLQSTFVSRKHAELRLDGDDLYLVDLGSASGTLVNGQRLAANEQRKISLGTEIGLADIKIKVRGPD